MIQKLAVYLLCSLVVTLNAIPIELYQRNIPVEVRYEGDVVRVIPRDVQARRNLDAKVQLDTDDLAQVFKHLPVQVEPDVLEVVKQEEQLKLINEEDVPAIKTVLPKEIQENVEKPTVPIAEKPVELPKEEKKDVIPAVKSLVQPESNESESDESKANILGKSVLKSAQQVPTTLDKVLQESHQIIKNGLQNLKDSFKPGKDELSPSSEQWATLEKAVDTYFDEQKQKLLKQTQPAGTDSAAPVAPAPEQNNWIQNIVNGFNGIATNFVQSIQSLGGPNNGNPVPQGQADEEPGQQPANQGFQGFVQFFNNGISNIVSTITGNTGPTTSNTNLSDSGAAPAQGGPIGFFGAIVSNVQNAFGIPQGQSPAGSQGDSASPVQQQQNGPAQVIQSVGLLFLPQGNAITNFFQGGNSNRPPSASGDEGAAPAQPSNTNIIQNIQNAIQNSPLNPFRPQGGTNEQNPIQNAIQSVGTQAQQLIPSAGQSQGPDSAKKPVVEVLSEEKPELQAQPEKPIKDNEISKKDSKTIPSTVA
ncbi:unnamed protein product [Psylliodes chrysocephalus]|uniref:Uncharacterized protein n=1 Tax=Psylliodes chrysocephalus TaxID=3402493 RepID=A0A9P0CSV7_9CUCU|nr:unnamed protein product [Psylliodes chrysocephala]